MRRVVVVVATLAPVAATAIAGVALQNRLAGGGKDEAAALAASNGLARRDGDALILRMANGADLELTDHVRCGDLPCPAPVMSRFVYRGWDATAGGFRIALGTGRPVDEIVSWDVPLDTPTLADAAHTVPRNGGPLAMPAPPAARPEAQNELSDWLAQTAGARDQVEAPLLAQSGDHATRKGGALILKLDGDRKLSLVDQLVCGQLICPSQLIAAYEFAGTSADGRYDAVIEHWSEGQAGLVVETDTGDVTALAGPPSFAPDGKRVAASDSDPEAPAPNALEVWSLDGAQPALAFAVRNEIGTDAFEIVGWDDADHLRLVRNPRSGPRVPAMLALEDGVWRLEGEQ